MRKNQDKKISGYRVQTKVQNMPEFYDELQGFYFRSEAEWPYHIFGASKGCIDVTGFSSEELTSGQPASLQYLFPEEFQSHSANFETELLNIGSFTQNMLLRNKVNQSVPVTARVHMVYDSSDEPQFLEGFISLAETGSVDKERSPGFSLPGTPEQKYKTLFDENLSANFIAGPDGKLIECNRAYLNLMGIGSLDPENPPDFNSVFTNNTHRTFFRKALESKGRVLNHEMAAKHNDGSTIYIILNVNGYFDEDGNLTGMAGYIQDITDRKSANLALKVSEERLRTLIESSNEWVWETDTEMNFTYSSFKVRELLGYNPTELKKKSLFDFVNPGSKEKVKHTFHEASLTRKSFRNLEFHCTCNDGTQIVLDTSGVPIFDSNGHLSGFRCLSRDVTVQKESEQKIIRLNEELEKKVEEKTKELRLTNKELEAFSFSVSHDLRAPLRSINGFLEAFREEYVDNIDDTGLDYLNRIEAAATRMSELITNMIDLARVSRAEINCGKLNLSRIAMELTKQLKNQNPGREAEITIQDNLIAEADRTLIMVVLQNLLENAWKFTSKQDKTEIRFGKIIDHQKEIFYIGDNGAGFDMEYEDNLFTPFQRLHSESEFPGTGIGLATVRRIIHRHSGKIWAESEPGKGATFYFTLSSGNQDSGKQDDSE